MATETQSAVNRLAAIRAEINELKAKESAVKAEILDSGETVIESDSVRCTVVESLRNSVDWKTIADRLNPSRQLVQAHTTSKPTVSIRLVKR